jgi:DNA invertase Pin-like site-specific DNA recombinase
MGTVKRAAIYVRVSTFDQEPENQLRELRAYVEARGWEATEFVDRGVSGAKDRRPALDEMQKAAKRRKFDVVLAWRLDRIGRNLKHLVTLFEELQALGIAIVTLGEGIDCTTPAGRLQMHLLGALAEFERERIRERVKSGMMRAKSQGKKFGRPPVVVPEERLAAVRGLPVREAAARLGVSRATAHRWLSQKGR